MSRINPSLIGSPSAFSATCERQAPADNKRKMAAETILSMTQSSQPRPFEQARPGTEMDGRRGADGSLLDNSIRTDQFVNPAPVRRSVVDGKSRHAGEL